MTPARIAFVHIPKTAGSSVVYAFEQALGPGRCASFRTAIDDAAFAHAQFVSGHVHLSSVLAEDAFVFTFLREPVAQLASHLRHLDRYTHADFTAYAADFSDSLRQTIAGVQATDFASAASLAAFFAALPEDADIRLRNVQCEVLAASPSWRCPDDPAQTAALAIANLPRLDFVGIVERTDRDLARLFRILNLSPPVLSFQNAQQTARPIDLNHPAIRAELARHVAADLIVYRHVARRYRWWRRWRLA